MKAPVVTIQVNDLEKIEEQMEAAKRARSMTRQSFNFTVDLGSEKREVKQSGVDPDDAMDLVWANLTDADKGRVRQIELDLEGHEFHGEPVLRKQMEKKGGESFENTEALRQYGEREEITEDQDSGDVEAFVRDLLWNDHLECCGSPVVGAEYMGQQEQVCCGCPEPALLNDAQIVASLRARFPEIGGQP